MSKYIIDFYEKQDGECPVRSFITKLEPKMQAKVLRMLDLLENNGPLAGLPYSKHLEDGIFEIRAKHSTNISRVLYFFTTGRTIILTNGFVKKTQKTPKRELELAKKYRVDYERRFLNE